MGNAYKSTDKPVSSFTICPAIVVRPFSFTDDRGHEVAVPVNEKIYVDVAQNIALIGRNHVDIGDDEYRCVESITN